MKFTVVERRDGGDVVNGVGVVRCVFHAAQPHRWRFWIAKGWEVYELRAEQRVQIGDTLDVRGLVRWNAAAGGVA